MEPGEDVVAGMKRELREEAAIEVDAMRLRGTVSWPGFGRHGEDHFGFIFVVDAWHPIADAIPDANEEGPLTWERIDSLDELPMWEGDRYFLPLVFDAGVTQFHGCLPYVDGRPTGWSYSTL